MIGVINKTSKTSDARKQVDDDDNNKALYAEDGEGSDERLRLLMKEY